MSRSPRSPRAKLTDLPAETLGLVGMNLSPTSLKNLGITSKQIYQKREYLDEVRVEKLKELKKRWQQYVLQTRIINPYTLDAKAMLNAAFNNDISVISWRMNQPISSNELMIFHEVLGTIVAQYLDNLPNAPNLKTVKLLQDLLNKKTKSLL